MSTEDAPAQREELQFDRVETEGSAADASTPAVVCTGCQKSLDTEYHLLNGVPACDSCRQAVMEAAKPARGWWPFVRAGLFGIIAAILGAILYYAVIAITEWEIGIVAIAIGYMVGYGVRKGAAGRGGRRFQILALLLTYWSVGLAYTPLVLKAALSETDAKAKAATEGGQSAAPPAKDAPGAPAATGEKVATVTLVSFLLALGVILVFAFALPVLAVFGSLPSGLISALIIGFGMRQAWQLTAAPVLEVSGPYKVGTGLSPAAG